MATMNIKIEQWEKDKIVTAIKKFKDQTVSVAKIAAEAGLNPNRSRFVVEELLEERRIKRVETKRFNARYIRYSYEVLK